LQPDEVRAATKLSPYIMGQGPHVGAAGTTHGKSNLREIEVVDND
jgi:hypothetical protein